MMQLATGTASDYAVAVTFQIRGKVVVGLDEPVITQVTLRNVNGGGVGTQSFANGTFRINNVPFGVYWISVVDSRFNLYENQFLLRQAKDSERELLIRLTRRGESAAPPELDAALYVVDAATMRTTPPEALKEFDNGLNALRNRNRNNPPDEHFKRAIAKAPSFYEAHLLLGLEHQKQNKDNDAIRSFERAAALKPAEHRPQRELGQLYWKTNQFEKVVDSVSKLIQYSAATSREHYNLGSALYGLNKLAEAEEQLLASINKGTDTDPAPFLQLHNVLMKMAEPQRGLAVLEDYLKLFPSDANHAAMEERARLLRERLKLPSKAPPG